MLRRRKFIRIISYLIALCVVFAASGVFTSNAKADYESTLGRVRFEALASLTEYSREISSGLRLLAVSTGDSLTDSSAYVNSRAVGALGSLGCFDSEKSDNLTRFYSGIYDFSQDYSGNETSRRAAVKLSDYALEIYYHLSDLTNAVISGEYTIIEHDSIYRRPEVAYFEDNLDFFNGTEDEIFEIISPASAKSRKSIFLKDRSSISADEAKKNASDITGISPALWRGGENTNSGGVEIYKLTNGDTEVDICKSGGIIYRIVNPKPCDDKVYNIDDARKKAVEFIKIHGFENMIEIDSNENMFTAEFAFAPEINGVLLLTAKIEIDICLASGAVTYFDASECIRCYRTDIPYTEEIPDISCLIPETLTLNDTLACVANIDGREKLCVLAVCSFETDKVYVFFDYFSLKSVKTIIHR